MFRCLGFPTLFNLCHFATSTMYIVYRHNFVMCSTETVMLVDAPRACERRTWSDNNYQTSAGTLDIDELLFGIGTQNEVVVSFCSIPMCWCIVFF